MNEFSNLQLEPTTTQLDRIEAKLDKLLERKKPKKTLLVDWIPPRGVTPKIWDEDLNELYTGTTVVHPANYIFNVRHTSINASPIVASNPRYYGVLFEHISGSATLKLISRSTLSHYTPVYTHSGGSWAVAGGDPGMFAQFWDSGFEWANVGSHWSGPFP